MSKNMKGSITVFVAVIFMSLIVLTGTFVDIIRISVASNRVDIALSSSVRSVMANYDKHLAGEFGIFGLNTSAYNQYLRHELSRYLRLNLIEKHKGLRLVEYYFEDESLKLEGMGSLINKDVLKKQILEYMRYKAPIIMADNVIEKLKSAKLEEKLEFAKGASSSRVKAKELRGKLDRLNGRISNVIAKINVIDENKLDELLNDLDKLNEESEVIASESQGNELQDFIELNSELNNFAQENEFSQNLSREFESLPLQGKELGENINKIRIIIAKANNSIVEIRKEIKLYEGELKELSGEIQRLESALLYITEENGKNDIAGIQDRIRELRQLVHSIQETIKIGQSEIDSLIDSMKKELAQTNISTIMLNEDAVVQAEHSKDLNSDYNSIIEGIINQLSIKQIAQEKLIKSEDFSDSLKQDKGKLEELSNKMYGNLSPDENEEENNSIMDLLSSLLEFSNNSKDKLYMTEYILDKYTFLTSKTKRQHFFSRGEVEYILSGKDIPYDAFRNNELNVIMSVLSQIWFLRFSINTVDIFVKSQIPHPIARLGWSLAEGAINATTDMLQLLEGKAVGICPSVANIKLKYSDHLRILLLMKSEDEIIRKMQQLMQVNVKNIYDSEENDMVFELKQYDSIIMVEAEVRVKLWFLPILNIDKLGFDNFDDDYYIIKKSSFYGY